MVMEKEKVGATLGLIVLEPKAEQMFFLLDK